MERWGSLPGVICAPHPAVAALLDEDTADLISAVREAGLSVIRAELDDRELIGSPQSLIDYVRARIAFVRREEAWTIFLDASNKVIGEERIGVGSQSRLTLSIAPTLRNAIVMGAASIILFHNHPSGSVAPSGADVALTRELVAAASAIEVKVLDHIIVSQTGWMSMCAEGLL